VLNTLTKHYFEDAFSKIAEALGTAHMRGREYFEGDGPESVFDQTAAPVLEIMDGFLYIPVMPGNSPEFSGEYVTCFFSGSKTNPRKKCQADILLGLFSRPEH
jgi:hypothetical protein